MNIIDAGQMGAIASYPELVDWLERSHHDHVDAMDDLMLSQPSASSGMDTLLVRAAWQRGGSIGIKLITVFPDNGGGELPAIQAVYVLFDGANGTPLVNLDGTELTYWKTAADSALGAKLLARKDCEELLMVGAGAQAPYLIRAHCAVRPSLQRVTVWNRTHGKAQTLAERGVVDGVSFACTTDIEAASRRADIICCATASEAPLVLGEWLSPGTHLDLVGGYKPEMIETDGDALNRSRVFVDALETTVEVCGDLCKPIASGQFKAEKIEGSLFDLCRHGLKRDRTPQDITVFKNGGGGHLDLMTASYFMDRAADR